jgi:hypothetical protein
MFARSGGALSARCIFAEWAVWSLAAAGERAFYRPALMRLSIK